jgi:TPR repeat protein
MRIKGEGILINKSPAAYYFKLSADQRDGIGQFSHGVLIAIGQGVPINKSFAAHYFQLSPNQG